MGTRMPSREERLNTVWKNLRQFHPDWVGYRETTPSRGGMRRADLEILVKEGRAERAFLPWLYRAKVDIVTEIMDIKRKAYWEAKNDA